MLKWISIDNEGRGKDGGTLVTEAAEAVAGVLVRTYRAHPDGNETPPSITFIPGVRFRRNESLKIDGLEIGVIGEQSPGQRARTLARAYSPTEFEKLIQDGRYIQAGNVQCPNGCGDSGEEVAQLWEPKSGKGDVVTYCPNCGYADYNG